MLQILFMYIHHACTRVFQFHRNCQITNLYFLFSEDMVRNSQTPTTMGQAGLCGVSTPGTDSLPLLSQSSINGSISALQVTLTL